MTNSADSAIVFFSRDGNTRVGADLLAKRLGGRLVELKEARPGNALQAFFRMRTKLTGAPWSEITSARRVFLMCPIWAGTCAPAMNAFATGADFTDKDVFIITFQQAPDQRLSHREHQHLAGVVARNHGSVWECYALVGAKMGKFAGEEAIRAQIDRVKLPDGAIQEAAGEAPGEEKSFEEKIPAREAPHIS
jgi:hypothetical protein